MPNFPSGQPHFLQLYHRDADVIRTELVDGLQAPMATVSPKYLYDALGSKLFEAICQLPEYYPTRTEAGIFERHLSEIARSAGRGSTFIDLGAGNCAKAESLFHALQPRQYVPIDISVDFLRDAVERVRQRFPMIAVSGIGMDFSCSLDLPETIRREKRLFFYPGSSIGNFTPHEAAALLGRIRDACNRDGGLLIGVDLLKDKPVLDAAYDDAIGVTAAFNLNMLRHLNTLVDADFDVGDWRHVGFFNEELGRIEMHLEARRSVTIRWDGGERRFRQGERIHTENSYKYTRHDFLQLLERAGFGSVQTWTDDREWFMVCHARAV
ncbi:L-histidine N(alpha)-methyltransferase [Noviherbaspirillum denitrificans]|uniref:Dimethylhistidine N-methyltransferase n=1 Tax=Noviherbaspirillum denitrificans TaxID=1968433 RepID=A0A254TJ67_9BURK|nr:L-histidine N(alpha)-methyltransferase [Noviherbaspirillum denitrificans]OWW19748.1 dimethylhistidine N-methyltransferase [Noviherbaspirillum denitrificans]